VPPPTTEFDRQLRELESEIRRLEVEYNLFFAGRLPKLPWETRSRVEALVKQYDRMHIQNTAERFRFQGLQSRFSAFCELWERSLRSREGARPGPRGRPLVSEPPATPAASASARHASTGAARPDTVALRDPESDVEKVRALHERLNAARRQTGEADVPFERFQEVVRAQMAKVGQGAGVTFRVGVKDGRATFTAKPAEKGADDE
jgi:hypothetical protein